MGLACLPSLEASFQNCFRTTKKGAECELHQGVYGKMTEIAKGYQLSRTFLYQLLLLANLQLETLLSDEKLLFHKDHRHFEQLIVL